jgi:DNA polymerase-3 subunit epsilon
MRQIIIDTETTGLDPLLGHRIIEIAGVEIVNRRLTGNYFHRYVNPERDSEEAALRIHGLTAEFLSDKPRFAEIAAELIDFVRGAEILLHNAAFDIAFINHELALLEREPINGCCANVVDTLRLAKELHPGKRNSLDMLCDRYQINHSARTLHGALLDAQLLAEVYLAMTRGQESLVIEDETLEISVTAVRTFTPRHALVVLRATAEENEAHERELAELDRMTKGGSIWMAGTAGEALHLPA